MIRACFARDASKALGRIWEKWENNKVPFSVELQRFPQLNRHALQLSGRCFILRALSRFIQSAALPVRILAAGIVYRPAL